MPSSPPQIADCPALEAYVSSVHEACAARADAASTVDRIVAANEALLATGVQIPDRYRHVNPDVPYTRNLVWSDPELNYSIIAIVWGSFQETRVHDHLNWCVVGMLEGECMTVDFERKDDESDSSFADLRIRESRLVQRGDVCALLPPPRTNIHRMASASRDLAVSLHTYGDPGTRARVFDPASGKVEILELTFHNT